MSKKKKEKKKITYTLFLYFHLIKKNKIINNTSQEYERKSCSQTD